MNSSQKGYPFRKVCLVASILVGLCLAACDDPPQAPEPSVDIDERQEALRQKVDEAKSKAEDRVDEVADQIPEGDTGTSDAAPQPE